MDAGYLRDTLGQVVAKGCAETIAVAPVDPMHYFSLWLLKHVENAKLVDDLQKERELLSHLQVAKQDKQRQADSREQEKIHKQDTTVNFLKSIQTDPYLLFDECLKAILEFTATPNDDFLLNKQLDRKTGPISFSVLLQGLTKLHVANVLYQEGMHFFQGLPLMGAYLAIPVSVKGTLSQVVALLCVDTLRKDHVGTGRPFTSDEQEFIAAVAQATTEALTTFVPAVSGNFSTKSIIKELQDRLQEVEASHKAESKSEQKKSLQSVDLQGEPKAGGEAKEEKEEGQEPNQVDETVTKGGEDTKDDGESPDIDEQDDAEDDAEEVDEKAEDDEDPEEAEQPDDVDDSQRQMQEMGRSLKQHQKKVAKLQKHFQKYQSRLEKQAAKVIKLEKQLTRSSGLLNHLCKLLTAVLDVIMKHKDEVFGQVKLCLFPTASVHRVLKALLYILGQSDTAVHEWPKSRQVLNEEICTVMKEYTPLSELDCKKWDLSDIFLDGLTEVQLSEEAPIGYLVQQWLLAAKKVAFETMKCNDYKTKSEKAAKDFADVEVEQMVAEIDLRVALDEEKKLALQLEDMQSSFAKELSSGPTSEIQEQMVEEEEAEEE